MSGLITALLLLQLAAAPVTIAQGTSSRIGDVRQAVARSDAEWRSLWRMHDPVRPAPPVDWSVNMVIAVFAGTKPTGGHGITISRIRHDGAAMIVEYEERAPDRGSLVTQAITSPFHIGTVSKHDGVVRFERRSTP